MHSDVNLDLVTMVASDGEWVEGALYTPTDGFPKERTSVVLIHGSFGNFYTGVPRTLAAPLAKLGYPSLAINTRYHDYFEMDMIFEEEAKDIQAAVEFLHKKGSPGIVLLGHSRGVSRVVYYASSTKDALVTGLILISGHASSTKRFKQLWGRYDAERFLKFAKGKALTDPYYIVTLTGKGERVMSKIEWYNPKMPVIVTRPSMTARSLVDRLGPDGKSDAIKYVKNIQVPILIVQGSEDEIVRPWETEKLKTANTTSERVCIKGAGHYFKGHEKELIEVVAGWLGRV